MPETHLAGNPFATAPVAPPPGPPKHKPGNPFAPPEIDTNPPLPGMEPADPILKDSRPGGGFDPTWLSREAADKGTQFARHAGATLTDMAARMGAGVVQAGGYMSGVTTGGHQDPRDPARGDALAKSEQQIKVAEDAAGNIRKVGKRLASKIAGPAPTTTGQKIAAGAGSITGQLAPFVAAGPLGLAAGSGLNVAAEVGATPEESLLGMFSKEQAKSPVKRGLTALAGDVAIAAPLHYGSEAIKNYLRARRAVTPEELARMGEAIPGAEPPPEVPALPPSAPPAPVSRVGAVGNQPPVLPTMPGKRGPVVDLGNYPLGESPGGKARARPTERYQRTTKGGRGGIVDRSWMDESSLKDESQLTDKVVSGQQRRLLDLAHEASDASPSGGLVIDPGAKSAGGIRSKLARKEAGNERPDLSTLSQIGDINRASIVVAHPNDAGPVIAKLQESGWLKELDDKFAKPDELGYGAIHAQLVDPVTGQASELQIHTPQTWAARQDLGAHDIYDYLFSKSAKPLVTPSDHMEARRLIEYNRKLYAEAHEAAMLGQPLKGADSPYRIRMGIDPESPDYGRWRVEEKVPGKPFDVGPTVAEADNPFKARTLMNELDDAGARDSKAALTAADQSRSGVEGATTAPEGVVSTPESARSARTSIDAGPEVTAPEGVAAPASIQDVPHGNYPQSDVEKPPLNPFRERHAPAESKLQGPAGHEDVTYFGNRAGAVGNQPGEPRVPARPPTRKVRSPYEEQDIVYWPRNSRGAIQKAKEVLNLSTAGLDKTATARVRTLLASGLDQGTIGKGYRSFAEMDLSTLQRKRELLKELVEDPNTLIGGDKLQQIPTDDIKAMWMIAHDNTKTIEAAARVMNDPLASEAERLTAADLHDKAYKQTEELLSKIVTGTAQKGRELGALRNIAKQSTDPEVWLVQAKRMLGDRPLPDAVQANIRALARRAQEACL